MKTFFHNWPYLSSFIKRTAICILCIEWYMMFFGYFDHCEEMPKPIQSEFVEVRKMGHKSSDSTFMPFASLVRHDEPTIFGRLDDSIQFGLKSLDDFYGMIISFILGIPCVGEKVIKPNGDKNQQKSGERQLSSDDSWFVQAILLLIVLPLFAAFISTLFTHNRRHNLRRTGREVFEDHCCTPVRFISWFACK